MADATDYLLEAAFGVLSGVDKAYTRKRNLEDEDALTRRKIKAEEESKIRVLEKTPRRNFIGYDPITGEPMYQNYEGALTTRIQSFKPEKSLEQRGEEAEFLAKKKASGTAKVKPIQTQEDKFSDDLSKLQFRKGIESLETTQESVIQSAGAIKNFDKALELIEKRGVTGKGGQLRAWAAPIMETFGFSTEGLDDAALFSGLVGTIRGPLRLAVIGPGPVSGFEQKLLTEMSGGGGTAKESSKTLINFYKTQAIGRINKYNKTLEGLSKIDKRILEQFAKITFEDEGSVGQGGSGLTTEQRKKRLSEIDNLLNK